MKVQWRLALCCAVVFIGWISAEEGNRRKVIIHVPHMHHSHNRNSQRHLHKSHGHSKGNSRPGGVIHKHHHHFHDDELEEPSHSHHHHPDDDHGHHHHQRRPHHHHSHPRPHHHSHPSHHHSHSSHSHPSHHHSHSSHHHSHPRHHHSDHHGHSTHHVDHHSHPEDHGDLDHHFRAEESQYDHHGDYSQHHHRPHRYVDHDSDYDCMEVCEKCKMKSYHRHHTGLSRGHDIMRAEKDNPISATHPQLTVSNFKQAPKSPTAVHGSYSVRVNEDFKPILAAGELSEAPSAYGGGKVVQGGHNYGGYVLPTAMEQAVASNSGKVKSPVRHEEHRSEFDVSFPSFPSSDFQSNGNWYNNSYYFPKHEEPSQNAVGYHQSGGVQLNHYVEEGTHHVDNTNNDGRGRDLRYLNRYKYDINR